MKRGLFLLVLLLVAGVVAWLSFGGLDRVTESRITAVLTEKGVPPETATCMAGRMVDRLSLPQLRKLERMRAQEGEAQVPVSLADFVARVRRVEDPEVIEVTASSAAYCAIRERLG